jgi:hypothetical protein
MTANNTTGEYHDLRYTVPSEGGFSCSTVDDGDECPKCGEYFLIESEDEDDDD